MIIIKFQKKAKDLNNENDSSNKSILKSGHGRTKEKCKKITAVN